MSRHIRIVLAVVLALVVSGSRPGRASGIPTYLALGDSMAFGETNWTQDPSNGDRGYVSLYANHLATANGGVRPNVINFGVDGETTTTFFQGGPQGDGTLSGFPAPQLNTNYPDTSHTQNDMLQALLLTHKAAGLDINTVSVQLGANDLLATANNPTFFTETPAQQQAQIMATLGNVQANYTHLLTEIRTALPTANILLMGYHNPFAGVPASPLSAIAGPAIQGLNSVISGEAAAFGARYVDTYTPFLGHELEYTYIASGNVHPNAAGYAVIAAQMDAQTVPEPSTLAVLAVGMAGVLLRNRFRSRLS